MSQDIEGFVRELNNTWQQGKLEELTRFYHPDVVLLPPDAGEPIYGRSAVIDTYGDFASAATLHEFVISSLEVFDFAATAVVHMGFAVEFSLQQQRLRESGLEVYVLNITDGEPAIVWRCQNILESREIIRS
ncbi:MAG: nuclear transport factor 2 family protein [Gammaproteobacteria bacterium]|nr:nuclear transport factor 2 family protein [Gammaproteobacteria bacterium]